MIFLDDLRAICPTTKVARLSIFVEPLNDAMEEFEINTLSRESAFLAQVAHESGGFNYVREIASGAAYEGREDLGNTESGDGRKFRGHGLIQITGRANHLACSLALYGDRRLLDNPALLEHPVDAARSAGWFWRHGTDTDLNELADRGNFKLMTRKINGGLNGYKDRLAYWERAQEILA